MAIFADLCFKLHPQPEVFATDALTLLLQEQALGDALARFLSMHLKLDSALASNLKFDKQDLRKETGRPDIVATAKGQLCLIIELKFWATLTDKQPNAYLDRLIQMAKGPRVLLFVAPADRHEALWSELLKRVKESGRSMTNHRSFGSEMKMVLVGNVELALVSWGNLLNAISEAAAGGAYSSDVHQLRAFTDKQDSEAFLPLRPNELSSQVGRRILQFSYILTDVLECLEREGICKFEDISSGELYWGYSIEINGNPLYFEISFVHWCEYRETPFWLVYNNRPGDRKQWPILDAALAPLAAEVPPRLFTRDGRPPMMPIYLPTGTERHEVIAALCKQIREIAQLLPLKPSLVPE